jgi:predicted amidohydrolase YtcJ
MQMKDGYTDGHKGEWILPPDELERRAKLYWDAGYQIHVHVNGDLGLEAVLDVLERRMRENPRSDHRFVIVHFACSSEDQVARIKRLGAIVSANPYYTTAFADKYAAIGLGPKRADAMVRARSVLRQRIALSYHSDLPMGPSHPLYLAWCGVNRITTSGRVAGPSQRIGVHAALRAITIDAAYSWRQEHQLGSIAPGKIANFTVLEQDPYAVPPAALKDIPIWGTVFEGRPFPVAA